MRRLLHILMTFVAVLTAAVGSVPWVLCDSLDHGSAIEIAAVAHEGGQQKGTVGHQHLIVAGSEQLSVLSTDCQDTPLAQNAVMARRSSDASGSFTIASGQDRQPAAPTALSSAVRIPHGQSTSRLLHLTLVSVRSHLTDLHTIVLQI